MSFVLSINPCLHLLSQVLVHLCWQNLLGAIILRYNETRFANWNNFTLITGQRFDGKLLCLFLLHAIIFYWVWPVFRYFFVFTLLAKIKRYNIGPAVDTVQFWMLAELLNFRLKSVRFKFGRWSFDTGVWQIWTLINLQNRIGLGRFNLLSVPSILRWWLVCEGMLEAGHFWWLCLDFIFI